MNYDAIDRAIDILNRALAADPVAIGQLISHRVPCNEELKNDPDVQIGHDEPGVYTVGPLGLINGLFGTSETGWGFITVITDNADPSKLIRFERTADRFLTKDKTP